MSEDDANSLNSDPPREAEPCPPAPSFDEVTLEYLEALAKDSFERQLDLDESVLRSLPFFGAALGLALAILGKLSGELPPFGWSAFPLASYGGLGLSAIAFAWAFRWFWSVTAPRTYAYPAEDDAVQGYAAKLANFHRKEGSAAGDLGAVVMRDMRLFMMDQYSQSAKTNRIHNARKTTARSQAMLFVQSGFALAFASGVFIFIHNSYISSPSHQGASDGAAIITRGGIGGERHEGQATSASSSALSGGGRSPEQAQHEAALREEVMVDKKAQPPRNERPSPPKPSTLRKEQANDSKPTKKD